MGDKLAAMENRKRISRNSEKLHEKEVIIVERGDSRLFSSAEELYSPDRNNWGACNK